MEVSGLALGLLAEDAAERGQTAICSLQEGEQQKAETRLAQAVPEAFEPVLCCQEQLESWGANGAVSLGGPLMEPSAFVWVLALPSPSHGVKCPS